MMTSVQIWESTITLKTFEESCYYPFPNIITQSEHLHLCPAFRFSNPTGHFSLIFTLFSFNVNKIAEVTWNTGSTGNNIKVKSWLNFRSLSWFLKDFFWQFSWNQQGTSIIKPLRMLFPQHVAKFRITWTFLDWHMSTTLHFWGTLKFMLKSVLIQIHN